MLKISDRPINQILNELPKDALMLDVGAAAAPFRRADWQIDIVPWEQIFTPQVKGDGEIRFRKETYIQHDICSREKWPIEDKKFDYATCSHVLEDIRDPLWVCSEMIRVSKAGYIEIPSKVYETTFGIEAKGLAGAAHHRWVIDVHDGKLRFTFKYMYIHKKAVNKSKAKYDKNNSEMYLRIEWADSFDFHENWLNSGKEIFEFYLEREITEKEKWKIFRDTQDRSFFKRWLSYLKNTNPHFEKIFKKYSEKNNAKA